MKINLYVNLKGYYYYLFIFLKFVSMERLKKWP